MGILENRQILVTGVTTPESIAYAVVRVAQQEGARVIVANLPRAVNITRRVVARLETVPEVLGLDVTDDGQLGALADDLRERGFAHLDGLVHAIAYAHPQRALGGAFLQTEWDDVGLSLHTSAYSLKSLAMACRPLLGRGSSIVGLTYDAGVSWPAYDWMGVSKAALESVSRYLARYLGPDGVRCNLVSAGPLNTMSKKAIPGADLFDDEWARRAPLGWDPDDAGPTAKAVVALLSDWFPATTGQIVHVDGGVASTGA
ncbi:MAG: enoyl-ACP reductase FabI [Actinomycetia bacterium]|nr:enoyl-ACP reductase FabI [Actinomycetes bacterium]